MSVKGKIKDNMSARIDLALYYYSGNIQLVNNGLCVANPKATFALNEDAQLLIFEWHKNIQFPNGYASNIARLVNLGNVDCIE